MKVPDTSFRCYERPSRMIEARGLSKRYGEVVAASGVSFTVGRGEVVGLLGPNGAGKTTVLRMLAGVLTPIVGRRSRRRPRHRGRGVRAQALRSAFSPATPRCTSG